MKLTKLGLILWTASVAVISALISKGMTKEKAEDAAQEKFMEMASAEDDMLARKGLEIVRAFKESESTLTKEPKRIIDDLLERYLVEQSRWSDFPGYSENHYLQNQVRKALGEDYAASEN